MKELPMELSETLRIKLTQIRQSYPLGQSALMPALHAVQEEFGHIPADIEPVLGEFFQIAPERVHEATTFYTMFQREPIGKTQICLCGNLSCWLRGYEPLREHLEKKLGISMGQTTPDGKYTLTLVECLGMCDHAPVVQVNGVFHGEMTPQALDQVLEDPAARTGHE